MGVVVVDAVGDARVDVAVGGGVAVEESAGGMDIGTGVLEGAQAAASSASAMLI